MAGEATEVQDEEGDGDSGYYALEDGKVRIDRITAGAISYDAATKALALTVVNASYVHVDNACTNVELLGVSSPEEPLYAMGPATAIRGVMT